MRDKVPIAQENVKRNDEDGRLTTVFPWLPELTFGLTDVDADAAHDFGDLFAWVQCGR